MLMESPRQNLGLFFMKMPVLFIGHGSPMNALATTPWTEAISQLGRSLPRPEAILCVSAHWETQGVKVLTAEHPKTIHDFGGFPQELFEVQYPAQGSPEKAHKTLQLLRAYKASPDVKWGLDHGTWSVLVHMYPQADIPVFQLSLDKSLNEKAHFEIGKSLRNLREQGVLILGSGNIVHNLRKINWKEQNPQPFDWNVKFDSEIKEALLKKDHEKVIFHKQFFSAESALAVPTDEHYLPLLYCLGASEESDSVTFPYEGYEMGSLSMRAVQFS